MERVNKDPKSPPVASVSTTIPTAKDGTKIQQDTLKSKLQSPVVKPQIPKNPNRDYK